MPKTVGRRYRCKFYTTGPTASEEPEVDDMGQLVKGYSLVASGLFEKTLNQRSREVAEGDRSVGETEFLLIGTWTKSLQRITHGMYCYIPSLSKLFAVNGDAVDKYGNHLKIMIKITDNVTSEVISLIPGAL
jgi:hypothetical protein